MINKGIKWMFNSSSPFYVKPRLDGDFLNGVWLLKNLQLQKKLKKQFL